MGTDQVTLFEETYLLWDIILLLLILACFLILYKKKRKLGFTCFRENLQSLKKSQVYAENDGDPLKALYRVSF